MSKKKVRRKQMDIYYQVLGADQDSSQDEIKSQYRFLVQAWHPDRFSEDNRKEKAERKLKEINKAYDVLGDGALQVGLVLQALYDGITLFDFE